jgi:signal transduction histidine kinase
VPSEQWPFFPERLTDILPEEQIKFFQSGAAVRARLPMSIVELRLGPGGAPEPYYIPTDDRWLNYCSFCKFLREEPILGEPNFQGGDMACMDSDGQQALAFLQHQIRPQPRRKGIAYFCHMGLLHNAAPIEVVGHTVAMLFGGQGKPEAAEQVSEIHIHVKAIGTSGNPIQCSPSAKATLDSMIATIPTLPSGTLSDLEEQAHTIAGFATQRWQRNKRLLEEEFLASLRIGDTADEHALDAELARLLEQVANWCGVEFACAFIANTPGSNVLTRFVQYGLPAKMLEPYPQFNWTEAGLPGVKKGALEEAIESGSLAAKLKNENAAAIASKFGFAYAVSLVSEHRLVFCLGHRYDKMPLCQEKDFLSRLAGRVCHLYLERKQFLDLKAREEQWEDIASLLGHRLRGGLTPIVNGAQMVRVYLSNPNDWASAGDVQKALDAISAECDALNANASEILEFWDWIAGTSYHKFESHSLAVTVKSCAGRLRGVAERANLSIRVDSSIDSLPPVEALGRTLDIAISNILENAIKYSFKGSHIEVRGEASHDHVVLKIENYGIGIPDDEREKVFTKRYRGKFRGRKMPREGEGLGLWQVAEIVKAHGGTIKCHSQDGDRQPRADDVEGFKTVFTLVIPISQPRRLEEKA